MPIANCKHCGRIFNRIRRDICQACVEEEARAFDVIRSYLRENPNASVGETSEATEIEAPLIIAMIQDGRLILRDNPNFSYPCERCEKPTQTGRYCSNCAKELADNLQSASKQISDRMNSRRENGGGYRSRS